MEFIDSRHTPKNVLIRARKTSRAGAPALVQEYCTMRDSLRITPSLEGLLARELAPFGPRQT